MVQPLSLKGLVPRNVMPVLLEAVRSARVVVITGPRQSGKTTLANQLLEKLGTGTLRSLDDPVLLQAAVDNPRGFVETPAGPLVIDEVQRGGDSLVRAIKFSVDRNRSPGQFVITGSADFLTVPTISESLAGRAAFVELWPFSQGEIERARESFVDVAFSEPEPMRVQDPDFLDSPSYLRRLCRGGFPEVQALDERQRARWFRDYVRTVTQREVVELTGIRKARELPRLLSLLAAHTAGELVMRQIIEGVSLARQAINDYVAFLEMTYLIVRVPAWSRRVTSKVKRHPKVYLADSGLAAHLLGKNPHSLARPGDVATGPLFEQFVVNEIMRQIGWASTEVTVNHFRDRSGAEVDLVLEANDGRIVAIEVKAGASFRREHLRWLAALRDRTGRDFVHGFLLYAGESALSLGDRLSALPIAALWQERSTPGNSGQEAGRATKQQRFLQRQRARNANQGFSEVP